MVGTQMNVFGVLLGFLLPILIIGDYTEGEELTEAEKDDYKGKMFTMMITTALFSTVVFLLVLFTFRDKPGVPIWSTKTSESHQRLANQAGHPKEPEMPIKD
mmetsp:Transcript_15158/g.20571  ORF Transcript_15158/g.20571 Transcript_15158/m.20571 type:complete len:102 (+) Transcript_15158:558-863(+)|eukprot:CAMPEP_0170459508 /NCGR_PEP_ID=MMETSP0123-20130129/6169_1 /TAXON_ID=182087 /ORGANISM="Favella ehrenbergii, Strain Fehren 1" /LENGTH=101 /DNA_ID=CAMNT_0010724109 /DNA_START=487 /DNA_END=792 /DNA_ORIENTATION=-